MKLTPEQQQFFTAMESMFNSSGWKLLSNGWREEQKALPERMFFNAKKQEDLELAKLRYQLLDELITLPDEIARQKQEALEAPEDNE